MDENEKQQDPGISMVNKINTSKASVHHAAKAAAKAGAGDVAGAVLEVVADENFRNAIIAVVLIVAFLFFGVAMLVGTAITGTVEAIYSGYMENWDESWEAQGIMSNGNLLYLYGQGMENAQQKALVDTIAGLLFPETDEADNSELGDLADSTAVDNDDYRNALDAMTSMEALAGENGALRRKLEMIKGRVSQRGEQFKTLANLQYQWDAAGISMATVLAETFENPVLFAGVDLPRCRIEIAEDVFDLTDLQALKILAAYSIQKDCMLGSANMWDLMDYCGWYARDMEQVQPIRDNSIYNYHYSQSFGSDIGDVVEAGELLEMEVEHLEAPYLPVWQGSCAPQWYYEEMSQLIKNNEEYDRLLANGGEEAVAGMTRYETDINGQIDTDNFERLGAEPTFGIIDRLFSASNATLTISHSEYTGSDEALREFVESLTGPLKALWDDSYGFQEKWTDGGNYVSRTADDYHSVTVYTDNTHSYYLKNVRTGYCWDKQKGSEDGYVYFDLLTGNNTYEVYETWTDKKIIKIPIFNDDGSIELVERVQITTHEKKIDRFTTFPTAAEMEAYQLYFEVNVTYAARSVDEIIIELLGLWPGNLQDTETGSDGREYASGYTDNELLALTWTDTYTDGEGNSQTLEFTRQQPYQTKSYEDIILAIGDLLEIDTAGLFEPDYGYGESMVDMAMKEYEYYTANKLSGGMRYWGLVGEAIGWTFDYDVPWCAAFVLTTAWQCGFIGEGKAWGTMGAPAWSFFCCDLYDRLLLSGGKGHTSADGFVPAPGDIVFFGEYIGDDNAAHVGIVKEVTEDGKLVTIEGNSGNKVKVKTYSNYELGTYCWTGSDGIPIILSAYAEPVYPSSFPENPIYESVYSLVYPSVQARELDVFDPPVFLAGMTRFRWSQMDAVITELQTNYPTLYREAMRTAYDASDTEAFLQAWNMVASTYPDDFEAAQQIIGTKLYYRPLAAAVKSRTGFDWTVTQVREEIFLALATSSDQHYILEEILSLICSGLDAKVSDLDLLTALQADGGLHTLISGNQEKLWPGESEALRTEWINSIGSVLDQLLESQAQSSVSNNLAG